MDAEAREGQTARLGDRAIAARVLEGERELFELLMRRYNRRLFRLARSYLSESSEAEDVVQEAYLRAYARLDQFRGPSFGAWAARITSNEALARLRRGPVQLVGDAAPVPAVGGATESGTAPEQRRSPDDLAGRDQMLVLIERAIDALPRDFRTVFVLRAVEQLSVEETADSLNLKPATVKTRFHRARALLQDKLRRHLEELSGEAFAFGGKRCDRLVEGVFQRLDRE